MSCCPCCDYFCGVAGYRAEDATRALCGDARIGEELSRSALDATAREYKSEPERSTQKERLSKLLS